jgi:hypothetical protein
MTRRMTRRVLEVAKQTVAEAVDGADGVAKVRASLDAMSAACLLERYLEDSGVGAMPTVPCSYPPPPELAFFDYDVVRAHIREQYYSDPLSPGRREALIMQNLKAGKTAREVRRLFGPAMPAVNVEDDVTEEDGEVVVEEEEEEEEMVVAVAEGVADGRSPEGATRTALAHDAVAAVTVAVATSTDTGDDAEESAEAAPLTAADLELLEYYKIKAAKRKRGTLKRLHKKTTAAATITGEGESEDADASTADT